MTHEMGFACEVADRVFFMGDGYIVTVTEQEADLSALLLFYHHPALLQIAGNSIFINLFNPLIPQFVCIMTYFDLIQRLLTGLSQIPVVRILDFQNLLDPSLSLQGYRCSPRPSHVGGTTQFSFSPRIPNSIP